MSKASAARFRSSLLALPILACASGPNIEDVRAMVTQDSYDQSSHVGPDVALGSGGPARFAAALYDRFDTKRALKNVKFVEGFYRAPANDGYETVLNHIKEQLEKAGFGAGDERLLLEDIEGEVTRAWTPVAAKLTLLTDGEKARELHSFDSPGDMDRTMLPIHAPSCDVQGMVALSLDQLKKGMILVTDVSASQVLQRARSRGAVAVISASLAEFNTDPTGAGRHLDAVQFRTLEDSNTMPVAQISRNSLLLIEAAVERATLRNRHVQLHFSAKVKRDERPLRTLVATVLGSERPGEAVATVSHVQEPGANDNASGVAGMLEGTLALTRALESKDLSWPQASLVFVWGDEFAQTRTWLENTEMRPLAGISSDMTGQSKETGAIALLERMPDPGAITTLAPDAHSAWGAGQVDSEALKPNGFAIIARCALIDVGRIAGGWRTADHPWEGGSDHDIFNAQGVPGVLFWHFTDFTYHTSLDRLKYVDGDEMRRTTVAILSTALAVADPAPTDLKRYLDSLSIEREVRMNAAADVEDQQLEVLWSFWCDGARNWLRKLCLGIEEDLPGMEGR
jgi:aminopeptidase YwaD